jgi:hypothetical protein
MRMKYITFIIFLSFACASLKSTKKLNLEDLSSISKKTTYLKDIQIKLGNLNNEYIHNHVLNYSFNDHPGEWKSPQYTVSVNDLNEVIQIYWQPGPSQKESDISKIKILAKKLGFSTEVLANNGSPHNFPRPYVYYVSPNRKISIKIDPRRMKVEEIIYGKKQNRAISQLEELDEIKTHTIGSYTGEYTERDLLPYRTEVIKRFKNHLNTRN